MTDEISVIIPTYNRADCIIRAIESVFAQTVPAHQIVVVDDGSTDATADILDRYLHNHPQARKVVHYFFQKNQGPSAARNRGIEEAKGNWVAFLDSDDIWIPDKLELQCQALTQFGPSYGACFTDSRFVNGAEGYATAFGATKASRSGTFGTIDYPPRFIVFPPHGIFVQSMLLRKDLSLAAGGFDSRLFLGEDTDFFFRLGFETAFAYVNIPLVNVDRNPNRTVGMIESFGKQQIRLQQRQVLYEKWMAIAKEKDPTLMATIAKSLASIHNEWATWYLDQGDLVKAKSSMTRAIQCSLGLKNVMKWSLLSFSPTLAKGAERRWRRLRRT